jgi:hypothetical protein
MQRVVFILTVGLMSLGMPIKSQAGLFSGTYTFSGANSDHPGTSVGISFGSFTPTGVTADTWSSGTQRYGASGWATSFGADYVSFVLTPLAGSGSYVLNTLSFTVEPIAGMSTTGGGQWQIWNGSTEVTSGTFNLPAAGGTSTITPSVGVTFSSALTIRLLGTAHDNGHVGDLAFDDVHVGGVSPVPEPVNVALGIFSGVFLVITVARSRSVRDRFQCSWVGVNQWLDAV